MPQSDVPGLPRSLIVLLAIGSAVVAWFVGFDPLWSVAIAIAIGTAGAAIVRFRLEDETAWGPPEYDARQGGRGDIVAIAQSLASCDRLARPRVVRWMRSLLISEREDRLARTIAVRRMRALLSAELQDRGIESTDQADDEAIVALLGSDANAILRPYDESPVTTSAIERCLDAIERLSTDNRGLP